MFIIYAFFLGIVAGYLRGGRLKNLTQKPLVYNGLAFFAFILQIIIFSDIFPIKALPPALIIFLHILSYILLIAFLFLNRKNRCLWIIGMGICLNGLVILLNGGYMPTHPEKLSDTSMNRFVAPLQEGNAVHNSISMDQNTLLPWLGDIFSLPSWLPLSNVFSIGDILIGMGIFLYLFYPYEILFSST
ncbi:MAG: DUF5317 domain-containing protein [Clostridia bacterium]